MLMSIATSDIGLIQSSYILYLCIGMIGRNENDVIGFDSNQQPKLPCYSTIALCLKD